MRIGNHKPALLMFEQFKTSFFSKPGNRTQDHEITAQIMSKDIGDNKRVR